MNFTWLTQILVRRPYIILLTIGVFSCTCLIIPFTLKVFPNFADPQRGFETRGTDLSTRVTAWKNLVKATKPSGLLIANPKEILKKNEPENNGNKKKKNNKNNNSLPAPVIHYFENDDSNTTKKEDIWAELHDLVQSNKINRSNIIPMNEIYFCGSPASGYARMVLESTHLSDLFTLESLLALCHFEYKLTHTQPYDDLCIETERKPKKCCTPWSLANYVALINNKPSCLTISEGDVLETKTMLQSCAQYFYNSELTPDCFEKGNCKVPTGCIRYNAAYNILNFLTSTSFLLSDESHDSNLKQTMLFLPIASSVATLPYYHTLEKTGFKFEGISVAAIEFGIKYALFDEYLIQDISLLSAGGFVILICMWMYTNSLFLTFMTIIAIIFSLGISYFMYTLVLNLNFFPFMNLLAVVVALGIGADDAFIFSKAWHIAKTVENTTFFDIMNNTFNHAFVMMLVTSLTSAAAFLASFLSSITAIRCFGIFATIAVLTNCVLMLTWLPATIIVLENWPIQYFSLLHKPLSFLLRYWKKCKKLLPSEDSLIRRLWTNREQILIDSIINFRYYWIVLFNALTSASIIIVFYYPTLQLPNSTEFQLFDSSHPFEQYDMIYKHKFRFELSERIIGDDVQNYKLPIRFVWGILPVDNGNYLDPQSRGTLKLDPNFDISKKESQKWLLEFCHEVKKQPFYQPDSGALIPNCFIESFITWMKRRCLDPIDHIDRSPCCETEQFPYDSSVFNSCIVPAMNDLYETPSQYFIPGMAGPKFSKDEFPTIKAIVIEFDSNYSYSVSYNYMLDFIKKVDLWMIEQLKSAPVGMQGGWFISDVEFYDLQRVLSRGTSFAVGVSMTLALTVLIITTLNVLSSLYAVLTITCSILTVMAVLILCGWKLNILESIAISTAIGLIVDFSLHYIICYKLCPSNDNREIATRYALSCMAGPTSMAAITTGTAGALMMPSLILPYIQIGIFLVTVMGVSWLYATFYLGSLLAIAGPINQFGQFHYSDILSCIRKLNFKRTRPINRPTSVSSDTVELAFLPPDTDELAQPSVNTSPETLGNNQNIMKYLRNDSPSSASAITVIITDDN